MGWYAKQKARHEAKKADYPGAGPTDESRTPDMVS